MAEKAESALFSRRLLIQRSMSSGVVRGEVHWRNTIMSGCSSSCSRAWSRADSEEAVSELSSGGRWMMRAPAVWAVWAMAGSSVVTITWLMCWEARAF